MAMLNCSYDRLLLKVLYGVFVLAVFLPFCLSAVENCRPCGHGEYCSKFFGICLACKDYCPGDADCPSACPPIEPSLTTIAPTTTEPTSTQSITTNVASDVVVQQSTNANIISEGDITFSDNNKDDSELPAWLSVGLLVTMGTIVLLIFVCRKYYKTLKIPRICRFSSGDSENRTNIELDERPRSDRGCITETERTVQTNLMANQAHGCHQTTVEYIAVPVDDVDSHVIINLQRPSQPNSSAAPPDPTHPTSSSRKTVDHPFQSASVHVTENPPLVYETPQGACPSDQRSCQKRTPETHRKITDGSNEGHEISIGSSPFKPPNGVRENIPLDHRSAHGD
eukprot:XP_011671331.1 PREDICTED: uncharacterized protein LOC105441670 [Strongylocentrotus purpuratus]